MPSLLKNMQSWFEAPRAGSYGGRFVSVAIAQLGAFDQSIPRTLLRLADYKGDLRGKRWTIGVEFGFQRNGRARRADLAIFDADNSALPVCLVEIKYDDQANHKNAAQFKDYAGYCAKHEGTVFLCLTQYYVPERTHSKLFRECLFSDLAESLKTEDRQLTPAHLLVDYFREKGLTMEPLDLDALGRLMHRLFNPQGGAGRQQKNRYMIQDIPEVFRAVMTNVNVFGSEVSRNLKTKRVPVIDFETYPWIRTERLVRRISREGVRSALRPTYVRYRERAGGEFYAFAQSYLRGGAQSRGTIGIDYGYCFEVAPGCKAECYLYGSVWGGGIAADTETGDRSHMEMKRVGVRLLGNKDQCIRTITDQLCVAATEAIRRRGTTLATKQVLRRLVATLRKS